MVKLIDGFDRSFPYLRLSVTDVCNFRCQYCLPDGYQSQGRNLFLTLPEISRLVHAFAGLGVWKIRITGGEPTVRRDFTKICETIKAVPGIKRLALTTNGYRLHHELRNWKDAGVDALNVSIDSLDRERFARITGHDRLKDILSGMDEAIEAGFEKLKINVVLLRGINDEELDRFLDYVAVRPVSVRFIELMQTGDNHDYFQRYHVPGSVVSDRLKKYGWELTPREPGEGPAVEYSHPSSRGAVGIIAPYAADFCDGCNRLRVTARGDLRLCLFGELGIPLRHYLQSDDQKELLQQKILQQLAYKKSSHFLHDGNTGLTRNLSQTGG